MTAERQDKPGTFPAMAAMAARGFAMGAADIVPGVSGGTVALVVGIYDRLLANISTGSKALGLLLKGDFTGFKQRLASVEWLFLIPLAVGLLTAVGLLSSLIEGLLHDRPEEMAGLFFGLVIGSIVVAWKTVAERTPQNLVVLAVVGLITFVALGFQSGPVIDPSLLAFFGAGAVAICAMILPGVSGSFLLLMMGMYAAVLGAPHDRNFVALAVFGLGAVVGLALFSSGLGWLIERHHDMVLAALIGLMFGSLRVLWPWPNGVGVISEDESEVISGTSLGLPESDQILIPVLLAIVAFVVVVGVSRLAPTKEVSAHGGHDPHAGPGPEIGHWPPPQVPQQQSPQPRTPQYQAPRHHAPPPQAPQHQVPQPQAPQHQVPQSGAWPGDEATRNQQW